MAKAMYVVLVHHDDEEREGYARAVVTKSRKAAKAFAERMLQPSDDPFVIRVTRVAVVKVTDRSVVMYNEVG